MEKRQKSRLEKERVEQLGRAIMKLSKEHMHGAHLVKMGQRDSKLPKVSQAG